MGRVAAVVWAFAGSVVLLAALLEVPSRLGDISSGYAVGDAMAVLIGSGIAAVAGALSLYAGWRAWNGRRSWALALPAMILVSGAVFALAFTQRLRDVLGFIPLLASPYGLWFIWFLGPALLGGLVATLVVVLLDSAIDPPRPEARAP
jgi:ABC-type thiamin/hydroxymethylpyrimidine transport system permease subunit